MEQNRKYRILPWLAYPLWILLIVGLSLSFSFIISTLDKDLPTFEDLENPIYDEASIIYDIKGEPFGKYYIENRENISFEELSPFLINSLLATEDIRFYDHSGIDLRALFRVAVKTVLFQKESSGGGSTISQQLAKLLFRRPSLRNKTSAERAILLLRTKVTEWITAVKLEKGFTKEEIMTMYLNKFEFINGAHGIQAAAQTYFGKNQNKLKVEEAALLVGMLKNPSLYNPLRFPENATQRRDIVLDQLERYFDVSGLGLDTLDAGIVDMTSFRRDAHDTGPAPYFRSELTKWLKNVFEEQGITKEDGSSYNIYTDGLKIHTTIDLAYQKHAEAAVEEHMTWLQDRYWAVWKNKDPWTYEADSIQRIIRKKTLERKMKESERYLGLHNNFLGQIKSKIRKEYNDLALNENVIKTLVEIDKKRYSLAGAVQTGRLPASHKKDYSKLLDDTTLFTELKSRFVALQDKYKTVFSTEIPMQIFAYNDLGYKEVVMSPRDSVRYHNQHLQTSLLAVHPKTGHIKAWVGGSGFNYFKYDHVNSRRQVGSTIKPFVYATAISLMGLSPCQTYEDIQYTISPGDANFLVDAEWSPANANEEFTGNKYNLYQGLLYSKNSITVRLVKEMGNVDVIRELLDNAGIDKDASHYDGSPVIPRVPSICLGAVDLTLHEMAGAYTTFANNGRYTEPIFISHIEDKSGKTIYTGVPESKQAINPLYNGVMVDMLKNNVGGGYKLGVQTQLGGKTGTTNDYSDGWFMSIAPDLVTGVWSGGDDKWIRFLNLDDGQGFVMARPVVEKFLKGIEADSLADFDVKAEFPTPPLGLLELIDCDKYKQQSVEEEQNLNKLKQRVDEFEDEFDEFGDDDFADDDFGGGDFIDEEISQDTIDSGTDYDDEIDMEDVVPDTTTTQVIPDTTTTQELPEPIIETEETEDQPPVERGGGH